jgi:hypothetical protein
MKFIKDTSWEEVFEGWRGREASDPGWIECATKVKGWPDWESWRRFSAGQIQAEKRDWQIFEFDNPVEEIPDMLVGPFSGWQSRHANKNNFTFAHLLEIPDQASFWRGHKKIQSIIDNFPAPTEFIGLIREDLGKIICLEGHHRATAVTLAKKDGITIDFSKKPTIALARLGVDEVGILDEMLKRNSTRETSIS